VSPFHRKSRLRLWKYTFPPAAWVYHTSSKFCFAGGSRSASDTYRNVPTESGRRTPKSPPAPAYTVPCESAATLRTIVLVPVSMRRQRAPSYCRMPSLLAKYIKPRAPCAALQFWGFAWYSCAAK
jgi:hypothetical protein